MCGIIGYSGIGEATQKITRGLAVLEYRGYDSAGIAAVTDGGIVIRKGRGRVDALSRKLVQSPLPPSACALGHTRWATHGSPDDKNAHPHRVGRTIIVHNGIIENYRELRSSLASSVTLVSDTDTEVAAAVIDASYNEYDSPEKAIAAACAKFVGSYAFGIIFSDRPGEIYAVRRGSPLLLGRSADGNFLASDLTALLPFTREYHRLGEDVIARLCTDQISVSGEDTKWQYTELSEQSAQKGGFAHFMEKEIFEQPEALLKCISPRIKGGYPDFSADGVSTKLWGKIDSIQIVACGSATHAALIGKRMIEQLARIPASTHTASEYRYSPPVASPATLVLPISQSGETADTLAALRYAKSVSLPTLAIVNAVETTIAREADRRIYTYAGPEIAVATTKGYCTQVALLSLLALSAARSKGELSDSETVKLTRELYCDAPEAVSIILGRRSEFKEISREIFDAHHLFFMGRGIDSDLCAEAALKLKEISYIHAEAYAAGELKHGTISLIEDGTPVIVFSTDPDLCEKTESNIREIKSRGAKVFLLCTEKTEKIAHAADLAITLSARSRFSSLFAAIAALQLIAYDTAVLRKVDPDKPRNLAKSVTVE